jgi:ribosomal protein S27E
MTKPKYEVDRQFSRASILQCPSCEGINIALTSPSGRVACNACGRVGVIVNDGIAWEFGTGKKLTGKLRTDGIERR